MKLTKYLLLAILFITVCKRKQYAQSTLVADQIKTSQLIKSTKFEPKALPLTQAKSTDRNTLKKYDKKHRFAQTKGGQQYVAVVQYAQAVTPPNIEIPALTPFATIPNRHPSNLMGGAMANITLWGIAVQGGRIPVKKMDGSETIGYFWPESNIAQLNNGVTLVGVQTKHHGNYVEYHAIGPVWTWYSDAEIHMLKSKYHVTPSAASVQQDLGTIKIDGQTKILCGIAINAKYPTTIAAIEPAQLHAQPEYHLTKKDALVPGLDTFREELLKFEQKIQ